MSATKEFGLAGIIGMPVAHSRSPVVHNYWLEEHGLPGRYVLLPVNTYSATVMVLYLALLDPDAVHRFLDRMIQNHGQGHSPHRL